MFFLIISVIVLYFLIFDGRLSFTDGLLLLLLLTALFIQIISREVKSAVVIKEGIIPPQKDKTKKNIFKFVIGAFGVVFSAKYAIIPSGTNIAHFLKVPEIVIGLSIVALGTSLPELTTAVVASFKKMGDLAAGNVIGANILNILWVLGSSSMINPLSIDIQTRKITVPFMFLITLLLFLFSRTSFRLTRKEGAVLFLIYIGYIFFIFKFAYSQIG
jgi:cation:H+ antiporter